MRAALRPADVSHTKPLVPWLPPPLPCAMRPAKAACPPRPHLCRRMRPSLRTQLPNCAPCTPCTPTPSAPAPAAFRSSPSNLTPPPAAGTNATAGAMVPDPAAAATLAAADAVPFSRLVWWSTIPVIKVFIMGLCGAALARQVRFPHCPLFTPGGARVRQRRRPRLGLRAASCGWGLAIRSSRRRAPARARPGAGLVTSARGGSLRPAARRRRAAATCTMRTQTRSLSPYLSLLNTHTHTHTHTHTPNPAGRPRFRRPPHPQPPHLCALHALPHIRQAGASAFRRQPPEMDAAAHKRGAQVTLGRGRRLPEPSPSSQPRALSSSFTGGASTHQLRHLVERRLLPKHLLKPTPLSPQISCPVDSRSRQILPSCLKS
jgi:hypothetical protein